MARIRMADSLKAVIAQRLLPRSDMDRQIPAVEILRVTGAIRDCILNLSPVEEIIGPHGERPRGVRDAVVPTAPSRAGAGGDGRVRGGEDGSAQSERLRTRDADARWSGSGSDARRSPAVNLDGCVSSGHHAIRPGDRGSRPRGISPRISSAWCGHPIAGLVVGGSTGEQALLDEDELLALVARGARTRSDGMALIAGTGAESTRATIRLCDLAGP